MAKRVLEYTTVNFSAKIIIKLFLKFQKECCFLHIMYPLDLPISPEILLKLYSHFALFCPFVFFVYGMSKVMSEHIVSM